MVAFSLCNSACFALQNNGFYGVKQALLLRKTMGFVRYW